MCEYHRRTLRERGRALSRSEFVDDRDWYGSHDFRKIQEPLGLDATLWCFRPIPGVAADESVGFFLGREKGRRDFSDRERSIAEEALAMVSLHVGGSLARFADPSPRALTPRARQVLACLLEGDGDKQVSARLGLSTYTVNQYTKSIFRHFRVRSRAELLARWIRRGWGNSFHWLDRVESGRAGGAKGPKLAGPSAAGSRRPGGSKGDDGSTGAPADPAGGRRGRSGKIARFPGLGVGRRKFRLDPSLRSLEVSRGAPSPEEELAQGEDQPLQALRRDGPPAHRPLQEVQRSERLSRRIGANRPPRPGPDAPISPGAGCRGSCRSPRHA